MRGDAAIDGQILDAEPPEPFEPFEQLGRLADMLRERLRAQASRTLIVGIVGLPGCGKSTLTKALLARLAVSRSASVSLDDFYLTANERRAIGRELRGPPGTHALPLLHALLDAIATRRETILLPVFDRDAELRLPPRTVEGPLDLLIIEGWFVGARCAGYQQLADALDVLIFVDMDPQAARAARLAREAELRNAGKPSMSETQAIRFWHESLAPYFAELVFPLRARADAVITVDAAHRITQLSRAPESPCQTPQAADRESLPAPSDGGSI